MQETENLIDWSGRSFNFDLPKLKYGNETLYLIISFIYLILNRCRPQTRQTEFAGEDKK